LQIVNKCLVGSKKCELFHEDLKIKQVFFCSRLVKISSLEQGIFFWLFATNSKKILIAEFLKSKFSTPCLSSEINCKAQKSRDTRKVVFVALETRQIFSIKRPLIPELSIIKLILNRYDHGSNIDIFVKKVQKLNIKNWQKCAKEMFNIQLRRDNRRAFL